jgi:hypothetical protein
MLPARFTPQQEAWTLTKRSPYDKMPNFNSFGTASSTKMALRPSPKTMLPARFTP